MKGKGAVIGILLALSVIPAVLAQNIFQRGLSYIFFTPATTGSDVYVLYIRFILFVVTFAVFFVGIGKVKAFEGKKNIGMVVALGLALIAVIGMPKDIILALAGTLSTVIGVTWAIMLPLIIYYLNKKTFDEDTPAHAVARAMLYGLAGLTTYWYTQAFFGTNDPGYTTVAEWGTFSLILCIIAVVWNTLQAFGWGVPAGGTTPPGPATTTPAGTTTPPGAGRMTLPAPQPAPAGPRGNGPAGSAAPAQTTPSAGPPQNAARVPPTTPPRGAPPGRAGAAAPFVPPRPVWRPAAPGSGGGSPPSRNPTENTPPSPEVRTLSLGGVKVGAPALMLKDATVKTENAENDMEQAQARILPAAEAIKRELNKAAAKATPTQKKRFDEASAAVSSCQQAVILALENAKKKIAEAKANPINTTVTIAENAVGEVGKRLKELDAAVEMTKQILQQSVGATPAAAQASTAAHDADIIVTAGQQKLKEAKEAGKTAVTMSSSKSQDVEKQVTPATTSPELMNFLNKYGDKMRTSLEKGIYHKFPTVKFLKTTRPIEIDEKKPAFSIRQEFQLPGEKPKTYIVVISGPPETPGLFKIALLSDTGERLKEKELRTLLSGDRLAEDFSIAILKLIES